MEVERAFEPTTMPIAQAPSSSTGGSSSDEAPSSPISIINMSPPPQGHKASNKASRTTWSNSSVDLLEAEYTVNPFPGSTIRSRLALSLNATERQVQVWFQNRRQRARKLASETGDDTFVPQQPSKRSLSGRDQPSPHASPQQRPRANSLDQVPFWEMGSTLVANGIRGAQSHNSHNGHSGAPPYSHSCDYSHRFELGKISQGEILTSRNNETEILTSRNNETVIFPVALEEQLNDMQFLESLVENTGAAADPSASVGMDMTTSAQGEQNEIPTVPTGVDAAQHAMPPINNRMQMLLTSTEPYKVLWASEAWLAHLGFSQSEMSHKMLAGVIAGPPESADCLETLMGCLRIQGFGQTPLLSYTKNGEAFVHTLRVEPLKDSSGCVQAWQAESSDIHFVDLAPKGREDSPRASAEREAEDEQETEDKQETTDKQEAEDKQETTDKQESAKEEEKLVSFMKGVRSGLKLSEMIDIFELEPLD